MKISDENVDIEIHLGDCIDVMMGIDDESIDSIIVDPPYGTTQCKWDSIIPLDEMWDQINRVIKKNRPVVVFGSEPFSSLLRVSNIGKFKYDWIWDKKKAGNFRAVKSMPLMDYEKISVFNHSPEFYNPQMTRGRKRKKGGYYSENEQALNSGTRAKVNDVYYPKGIIEFSKANNIDSGLHPTQKPLPLLEYLVKTYSSEGDTVLDFTMGSGTTLLACKKNGRNCIGVESSSKYFDVAKDRLNDQ